VQYYLLRGIALGGEHKAAAVKPPRALRKFSEDFSTERKFLIIAKNKEFSSAGFLVSG